MARPKLHATPAARQLAYTDRARLVRVTVPAKLADTLATIAGKIDASRGQLAGAMIEWALAQPETLRAANGYRGSFDARIDGPTVRIDVPLPEGAELRGPSVAALLQLALVGRQWSRFGANWRA